ncbi:hypothetical protein EX895_000685 [Sporisorium graminicola]|uniref:Zn(2)-C6 fungal-type domain-containing protein n=1 Tax=Sporisorium graminicola TaxID=280036 RepID=A0A4U7L1U6_9BASI|nr:hypothetical protein EX895_000685 [Sporisorium graminicola]TKY90687.1 hypothetical protein EX895_000685 [Sporisorium graminicola]
MTTKIDAAGPSSPPPQRTRKPGEVRSRSGCITCKQRRKKCDEDFRIRQNGATSCNRCADRGLHCEFSSHVTPQRPAHQQQQQRPSPYPTSSATPSGSSKIPSRAVRGPSATPIVQQAELPSVAAGSAAPSNSGMLGATPSNTFTASLDPTQSWNASAHFPVQSFAQPQLQNATTVPGLQNQLAWMNPSAAMLNRSAIRYNRPNIWPMGPPSGTADPASAAATQPAAGNLSTQSNAVDMNALYTLFNSNPAAAPAASNTTQWTQGYPNSMDNIMLDDFVNELMSLTGPLAGSEGTSSASLPTPGNTPSVAGPHPSSPFETQPASRSIPKASTTSSVANSAHPFEVNTTTSSGAVPQPRHSSSSDSVPPASAQPNAGVGKAAATSGRASNRYRKLLDSDAIESLLSKYSPIYERFWHATLMLLSNKKRQAAVDYLMRVIRSNKACRASVVVVCLAYHELVQRVRKGTREADAKQSSQRSPCAPPNWTSVATDAVNNNSKPAKTPEDGMSHTILSMFPESEEHASSRSGTVHESSGNEVRRSHIDDDEGEDEDEESEEEISTIERRRSGGDGHLAPTPARATSERYGSTSFSRRSSDKNGHSPLPAARSLTGKLSSVENNIHAMDDPAQDRFKGQIVEEHTVELWFDIAQAELQRSRDELSFDQELCAIINLRWACLCFAGAERARQLTEELGKVMQREGIDMDHAAEEEKKGTFVSVMLLTAVYTDVLDTVSDRGKRTYVALRDGTRKPAQLSKLRRTSSMEKNGSPSVDEPFFGRISLVSLELLTCFKLISDLSADVWGPISSAVSHPTRPSEEEVANRSREIERKVMSLPSWSDPNTSSSLRVRAFALQEIWRQTARLYLLQAVHRRGPLYPELQNILHEIIRLAKMIKIQSFSPCAPVAAHTRAQAPANYIGGLRSLDPTDDVRDANHPHPYTNATFGMDDLQNPIPEPPPEEREEEDEGMGPVPFQMWLDVASWEMCTVWFLCSTVALTRQDRQFCIHHLESLGLERSNRDNIQVIRDYWAKQDSTGHTLDWFDFVKSTGRSVVFAF